MFEEYLKELEEELIKLGVKSPAPIVEEYRQKFLNLREKGQSDFEILVLLGDAPDVARSVVKGRKESAEETLEHNFMLLQQKNRQQLKENGLSPEEEEVASAEKPKEVKKQTQNKKSAAAAKSVSTQNKKTTTKEKPAAIQQNETPSKIENAVAASKTAQESIASPSSGQTSQELPLSAQEIEQNKMPESLAEKSRDVSKKQEKFSPLADGLYTILSAIAIIFANVLIIAVALLSLCAGLYFSVQSFLLFEETAFKVMGFFCALIGIGLGVGMGFVAYKMLRYTVKAMGEYAKKLKKYKKGE